MPYRPRDVDMSDIERAGQRLRKVVNVVNLKETYRDPRARKMYAQAAKGKRR